MEDLLEAAGHPQCSWRPVQTWKEDLLSVGADVDCLRMGDLVEWKACRQASDTRTSSLLPFQRLSMSALRSRDVVEAFAHICARNKIVLAMWCTTIGYWTSGIKIKGSVS